MAVHQTRGVQEHPSLRVEGLIGRVVRGTDKRVIGRLEEVRVERSGRDFIVSEYILGPAGLMERLGLGVRSLFGGTQRGYIARWDQLDVTDPDHPTLTCPLDALKRVK